MRKLISIALLLSVLISLLSLTACHRGKGLAEFEMPNNFNDSKKYEISFWAKNDSNTDQVNAYKQAIKDFESYYPNIKVNLKLYTDYTRIYNDVITNIATGTTPNVCITYPDHIATYKTGTNIVVPLDELMNDEKYGLGGSEIKFDSVKKEEIVGKFLDECIIDGEYYALPYMRSTEACFINKDFVEALGYTIPEVLTWDFVWEVSEAAMEKNDDGTYKVNGQKIMIPFIYKSTDNMMIQMLEQQNAGYSTEDGKIEIFNDTTEEILLEIAEHTASGAFSTFKRSEYPANFLNRGQCIFAIDSTAGASWMGSYSTTNDDIPKEHVVEFETVVKEIPQYDTSEPKMISQGPSICIFNKNNEQEVVASWLFAQFLLTDDPQISYATIEGYVPVTTKAQTSERYLNYLSREGEDNKYYYDVKIQATKLLINNTENTFVTPVFNGSASLRNAAGQLIEYVVFDEQRGIDVTESSMSALYRKVSSLYKLDSIGEGGEDFTEKKEEFGELPKPAVTLIVLLCATWLTLIAVFVYSRIKSYKKEQ